MTAHQYACDPLRILVADDDAVLRSLMRARLVRFNGHAVEAEDGLAAWTLLCSQSFDMAIVDLGMPNLDGISLIQCMRGHPRTRHMPIIVVTSQDDRGSIDRAFAAGASAFLIKPVVWSTFEHHIGFLLRLVETARDARTAGHQAAAASRAKDTIVGNICGGANAAASSILREMEFIKSMPDLLTFAPDIPKRLDRIVNDCLALQSLAEGATRSVEALSEKVIADDRKANFSEVVTRVYKATQVHAAEAGVYLSVTLPPGQTILSCDATSIELAMTHLVHNAIAYSHRGSRVAITGKLYQDGLLGIEVEDHGTGMHPEAQSRCLAPRHATYDDNHRDVRFGHGLLLARAIAEAHDGSLELRSDIGRGTIATLVIPADRIAHVAKQCA
jgi:two-component system, sensor histidine kinase and response regulator